MLYFSHAQALATLKAYSHWLSQFGMQSQSHNDHKEKFFTIMSTVIDSLLPLFEKDVSKTWMSDLHVVLYQIGHGSSCLPPDDKCLTHSKVICLSS